MKSWKRIVLMICVSTVIFSTFDFRSVYAESGRSYTVQSGDTMLTIAGRFGVSVFELAAANGVTWSSWVYAGQRLVIPGTAAASHAAESSTQSGPLYATDPRVPDPQPELPVIQLAHPGRVVPTTYARVIQDNAPVYTHPSDVSEGRTPKRYLGVGYVWVSVQGQTTWAGQDYYEINNDEYVPSAAVSVYNASGFRGVALEAQPERPFAWILKPVQPLLVPGGEINPEAPIYQRYDPVQIYATDDKGDEVWYLIGPHQWINQVYVGKVTVSEPPEGIEPGARWIEVDLFEQTIAAYQGEQMVYASLVSSGLRGWDTPPGLFRVWLRVDIGKMSGGHDRPDYYFLEDVPWTMYFNRDIALHTAYWHDGFGYRRSHGCVNLAPLDARWLYEWAPEKAWVWVHGQETPSPVSVAMAVDIGLLSVTTQ